MIDTTSYVQKYLRAFFIGSVHSSTFYTVRRFTQCRPQTCTYLFLRWLFDCGIERSKFLEARQREILFRREMQGWQEQCQNRTNQWTLQSGTSQWLVGTGAAVTEQRVRRLSGLNSSHLKLATEYVGKYVVTVSSSFVELWCRDCGLVMIDMSFLFSVMFVFVYWHMCFHTWSFPS